MPPTLDVGGGTEVLHGSLERAVAVAVPYLHHTLVAVSQAEREVLEAVTVVIGNGLLLRKPEARIGEDERCAERPVGVADQNRRPAPVVGYRRHEVLDRVAVEIGGVDVRDRDEGRVHDGDQCRLLDERPVADAVEAVDLSLGTCEGQVLEPVAVVVADGDLGHASASNT